MFTGKPPCWNLSVRITPDYSTEIADTTPEAERIVVELARERSGDEGGSQVSVVVPFPRNGPCVRVPGPCQDDGRPTS